LIKENDDDNPDYQYFEKAASGLLAYF
jgi:hypothetical protein